MQTEIKQTELQLTQNKQRAWIVFRRQYFIQQLLRQRFVGLIVAGDKRQRFRPCANQFSINWLGSSTASHGTPLIPEYPAVSMRVSGYDAVLHDQTRGTVITSSWVNRAGLPFTGRLKLVRSISDRLFAMCRPLSIWPTQSSIHAPPRLCSRAYRSR